MAVLVTSGRSPANEGDYGSIFVSQIDGTLQVKTGENGQYRAPALGNATLASPTISGDLTFSKAAAEIVPGATSIAFRNNADDANNLIITNAGVATVRAGFILTAGIAYIGDNANASMTQGLTINTGGSDDEALALKSSDVGHGMTGLAETDTYAKFWKTQAAAGGLRLTGLKDADGVAGLAVYLDGALGEAADTTHTAAGVAIVQANAVVTDGGTGVTGAAANSNLFAVSNNDSTRFIVDAEGDLFADGSDVTVYDEYDDVALVRAYELARVNAKNAGGVLLTKGDEFVRYNEQTLVDLGILGAPLAEGGLTNITRMQKLHSGALWQMSERLRAVIDAIQSAGSLADLQRRVALNPA